MTRWTPKRYTVKELRCVRTGVSFGTKESNMQEVGTWHAEPYNFRVKGLSYVKLPPPLEVSSVPHALLTSSQPLADPQERHAIPPESTPPHQDLSYH